MSARVDELLLEAEDMPYGPPRTGRVEEAVRLADSANDKRLSFDARVQLIESAVFGGAPEKAIVAFAWCLAASDAEPERFPEDSVEGDLLWMHKWVAGQVHAYPQLTREQVNSALDDMETRYTRRGISLRPLYQLRMHAALEMDDDLEVAHEWFRKWQWAKRDSYADCRACETHSAAEFHVGRGQHERAFEAAEPLLSGRQSCAEVPHQTYALLLESARALGRREELLRLHRVGLPLVSDNPDFLRHLALHIDHLVVEGELEAARPLMDTLLRWSVDTQDLSSQMWALASARFFFEKGGKGVRFPPAFTTAAASPENFFETKAKEIASRFDARNGNDVVSRRLQQHVR